MQAESLSLINAKHSLSGFLIIQINLFTCNRKNSSMKQKRKQVKWHGKRKWQMLRGSEYNSFLSFFSIVNSSTVNRKNHMLVCFILFTRSFYFSSAVLSRGWMESQRIFPRLQPISLRLCPSGKAWRERKSSSTSGASTRLTWVPAATGRSWCSSSHTIGRSCSWSTLLLMSSSLWLLFCFVLVKVQIKQIKYFPFRPAKFCFVLM